MKKYIKLILVITLSFLIFGCKNKEGYQLIELTGKELVSAIDKNEQIIYATINLNTKEGQNFKRDLERIAKEHHTDIYYVDSSRMNFWNDEALYIQTGIDTRKNYYYYTGKESFALEYTNYQDLDKNIEGHKSNNITTIESDSTKKEYLSEAKKYYEEGNLTESYTYLTNSWTLKEAKDYYNNSKYFKILNEWEYRSQNNKDITIKKITIFDVSPLLFYYEYNGKISEYTEPKARDYKDNNYIIKDDIIYIEENEEYIPKYKIISLKDDEMILEEDNIQTVYIVNKEEN